MTHYLRILFFALLGGFFLVTSLAQAQIAYSTPAQQKKELRKSLKEAEKIKTDYNESHLNVKAYHFRKGESSRKRVKKPAEQEEMLINEDGTAAVKSKPKRNKKPRKK